MFALFFVGGCMQTAPEPTIPAAILSAIVAHFVREKNLQFRPGGKLKKTPAQQKLDRHKGFFVNRRARFLGSENASWLQEPDLTTLKGRIDAEFVAVEAYIGVEVGSLSNPGPRGGGPETPPAHLDLKDVAQRRTGEGGVAARANQYKILRRERVQVIAWRAAGLHDDLWQPSTDKKTATLRQAAMNEMIDRRLRVVERMNFQVASHTSLGGAELKNALKGSGREGPWTDGFRVRMFEYPRIPANRATVVGEKPPSDPTDNVRDENEDKAFFNPKQWAWATRKRRLEWDIDTVRFPPAQRPNWEDDGYRQKLVPEGGATASDVIRQLFVPSTNWWARSWMFCDHACSALLIEALRFGLEKRNGNDNEFNLIEEDHFDGYISLWALVGKGPRGFVLGSDGAADGYFENLLVPETQLQIGDLVIFWNHEVYGDISSGVWRLENCIVMDLDSDPDRGGIVRNEIALQGHGTGVKPYPSYQEEIVRHLREGIGDAQSVVNGLPPNVTSVNYKKTRLIRWEPYETFAGRGAWWVVAPLRDWRGFGRFSTKEEALAGIRKTVTDPPPGASGDIPKPSGVSDGVLFPLWEPRMKGGWPAYFTKRGNDHNFRPPNTLQPVALDGSMMPGIFVEGDALPIPVVRAKARP